VGEAFDARRKKKHPNEFVFDLPMEVAGHLRGKDAGDPSGGLVGRVRRRSEVADGQVIGVLDGRDVARDGPAEDGSHCL
jgi:hypothetical protein